MPIALRLAASGLLCCTALLAQTAPCFGHNDQNTSVSNAIYTYSPAAPNTYGWQITPTTALIVQGVRVFTRNTFGSQVGPHMTLELWDDNPLSPGLPGTRLAGGTFRHSDVMSWQGANLDNVAVLLPGTAYWVVLTEPGWSTPPIEPGAATLPWARLTNGVWTSLSPSPLKVQLFCNWLDDQGVVPFGSPCTGSGGIGTLFTNQPAAVGNTAFRLEGSGFPGGALSFLVLGLTPGFPSIPIPGTANCFQNSAPLLTVVGTTGTGNVRAPAALGHVWFPIPIPAGMQGVYFSAQLAALDAASTAALPVVTSNALQVTIY